MIGCWDIDNIVNLTAFKNATFLCILEFNGNLPKHLAIFLQILTFGMFVVCNQYKHLLFSMLFITTFFLQTLLLYIYNMPFKISQGKGNNARPRIIAGENTINIVAETGVSKSTVNLMKRQVNLNYTKKSAGRRSLIASSTHNIIRLKLCYRQLGCVWRVQNYFRSIG